LHAVARLRVTAVGLRPLRVAHHVEQALLRLAVSELAALEVRPARGSVLSDAHEELHAAGEHLDAVERALLASHELVVERAERLLHCARVDAPELALHLERGLLRGSRGRFLNGLRGLRRRLATATTHRNEPCATERDRSSHGPIEADLRR